MQFNLQALQFERENSIEHLKLAAEISVNYRLLLKAFLYSAEKWI